MSSNIIQPRILKGFRDLLPKESEARQVLFDLARQVFRSHGFSSIDTPALEFSEILLGKGSEECDKQLFRFTDQGGRDIALRFDLTIPLARYVATHSNELGLPFKRFHIAPVWRAEKPQRGRYREFYQCDFDILGSDSIVADAEILQIAHSILSQMELPFVLRINHRVLLNAIIQTYAKPEFAQQTLRCIDKLDKLGTDLVQSELCSQANFSENDAEALLVFLNGAKAAINPEEALYLVKSFTSSNPELEASISQIFNILHCLRDSYIKSAELRIDVTIARGLDYYTGLVFETQLTDTPELGSVCSGGRYDNLTSLYSKQRIPGVGGSVGIDRLMVALENATSSNLAKRPHNRVFIPLLDKELSARYFNIATDLRKASFVCEIFTDEAKLGNQLKYASKNDFDFAVILGEEENKDKLALVKLLNSANREQVTMTQGALVQYLIDLRDNGIKGNTKGISE